MSENEEVNLKDSSPQQKDAMFRKLESINKKLMQSELITPNFYYMDLSFIRDIRIGCLLSFMDDLSTEEEREKFYNNFRDGLYDYQLRMYNDIAQYFPKLGISQEKFDKRYFDKSYSGDIFDHAPMTEFLSAFKANLEININHSQVAEKWDIKPLSDDGTFYKRQYHSITLVINTYPLELDKERCDQLGIFFAKHFGVNVQIINFSLKELPVSIFKQLEDITVESLSDLLENDGVRDYLEQLNFVGNYISAPFIFHPKSKEILEGKDDLKKHIDIVTDQMRIFSHFQWVPAARYALDLKLFPLDEKDDRSPMSPLPTLR